MPAVVRMPACHSRRFKGDREGVCPARYLYYDYPRFSPQAYHCVHHCLLEVPVVGRNQYGYIIPAFSGSPKWGEINLERSGCGGNEQKMGENA